MAMARRQGPGSRLVHTSAYDTSGLIYRYTIHQDWYIASRYIRIDTSVHDTGLSVYKSMVSCRGPARCLVAHGDQVVTQLLGGRGALQHHKSTALHCTALHCTASKSSIVEDYITFWIKLEVGFIFYNFTFSSPVTINIVSSFIYLFCFSQK